jgi:hypothetical protein
MEYSKLVSVTGLPGLYELVASKNDGAIVRSLDDKSTRFVSSRIHNFSHLESIEVYTEGENVNLVDVFHAMQNSSETLPGEKDADAIKKYFTKVYPSMDFDRVYASDMKKMVKWFDVLKKNDIEIKLGEETTDENDSEDLNDSNDKNDETPQQEPQTAEPEVKEPETKPEVKTKEPKKVKAAKTKKEEPVSSETEPTQSETKATRKKITKK